MHTYTLFSFSDENSPHEVCFKYMSIEKGEATDAEECYAQCHVDEKCESSRFYPSDFTCELAFKVGENDVQGQDVHIASTKDCHSTYILPFEVTILLSIDDEK